MRRENGDFYRVFVTRSAAPATPPRVSRNNFLGATLMWRVKDCAEVGKEGAATGRPSRHLWQRRRAAAIIDATLRTSRNTPLGDEDDGRCRVCGRSVELSFEHVPPRSAGNSNTSWTYGLESLL